MLAGEWKRVRLQTKADEEPSLFTQSARGYSTVIRYRGVHACPYTGDDLLIVNLVPGT